MAPSAKAALRAINKTLSTFPTICGKLGLFASYERNGGGFFASIDQNGEYAVDPIVGGEHVVASSDGGNNSQPMISVPVGAEGGGILIEPNANDPFAAPNAIGGYYGVEYKGNGGAVGGYIDHPRIQRAYTCPPGGG
jgi:hypothetical protein